VAIFYDRTWLAKFVTHDESVNAVKRVVANAQVVKGQRPILNFFP
jgi:hypothetical protein